MTANHIATPATTAVADRFPWPLLGGVLLVALVGRVLLLASGSVSFHSDEAVVALMARHILQGERPVFFYGQAYMGSLDAWAVALAFRLFGESVFSIRLAQAALYLGVVAVGVGLAWRLSERRPVALTAGLTLAVPPVLLATYTTATLGGYNETLLFGGLLLWLTYDVTHVYARSWWRWIALGLAAGLGWWTNGLIVAFGLPAAALIGLWLAGPLPSPLTFSRRLAGAVAAGLAFVVGSAPWWVFNLEHDFAAFAFLTGGGGGGFAGGGAFNLAPAERLIGLFVLGLPTLVGLRFPWTPVFFAPVAGMVVAFIYVAAVYRLARRGGDLLRPHARALVLGMIGAFCLLFLVSRFSADPTGRYFLPLALPFGIVLGTLVDALRPPARALLLALVLGYFAAGQWAAAASPTGLTTQFNPETHLTNDHDAELIAFLEANHLTRGYTNYWISFRLAFLSGERLQYSAALPYKTSLDYTPADDRYPAYREAADRAERIAYITANVPAVESLLDEALAAQAITYRQTRIGPFVVYHDFSRRPQLPR